MTLPYTDPHKQQATSLRLKNLLLAVVLDISEKLHTLMLGANTCPPFNNTHHHHPNPLCPPGSLMALSPGWGSASQAHGS
jgi:hypothetical protein